MPVTPEILKQLYDQRQGLLGQINSLTKQYQQVNSAIQSLEGNIRFNWTENALDCIRNRNKLLRTNDILECIMSSDLLQDEHRRRNFTVALSVALGNLCKSGLLGKVVVTGEKGHYYGLAEWFKDGSLLTHYEINLKNELFFNNGIIQRIEMPERATYR